MEYEEPSVGCGYKEELKALWGKWASTYMESMLERRRLLFFGGSQEKVLWVSTYHI